VEVVLFQVARELINNVLKHAQATRLVVETRAGTGAEGGAMVMSVTDDGAGFDGQVLQEPVVGAGGFGLYSVRERLEHLGGRMEVDTRPGAGTVIRVIKSVRLRRAERKRF